jgi:hypothetical protein
MPRKKKQTKEVNSTTEVLKDLLIVELAKAKVPHQEIRRIVGCDMRRVTKIARFFRTRKEKGAKQP